MSVQLRLLWFALLSVAIMLGATEGAWKPRLGPLDAMSIRVTISLDRGVRVESPDGTEVLLGSLVLADPAQSDATLDHLRQELTRLAPGRIDSGQPGNVLEIVAEPETPFRLVSWVMRAGYDPRVRIRRIGFWLSGRPDSYLLYEIPPEGPWTPSPAYFPTPMAIVRLLPREDSTARPETRAAAALTTGYVSGAGRVLWPMELATAPWRPMSPDRESVRRWIENAPKRGTGLFGALDLTAADPDVPYGEVLDALRGFADAGIPFECGFDIGR